MSTFGKHDPPYRGRFDSPLNLPKGHSAPPPMRFNGRAGDGPFGPYTAPAIPARGDAQVPKPWLQGPSGRGQDRGGIPPLPGFDGFGTSNPAYPSLFPSGMWMDRWGEGGLLGPWQGPIDIEPPGPTIYEPCLHPIAYEDRDDLEIDWRNQLAFPIPAPAPTLPHLVFLPVRAVKERLVVLLHGSMGAPESVRKMAEAYAQAGFRTIALDWNNITNTTARNTCLAQALPPNDTLTLMNECDVEQRDQKLEGIERNLVALLDHLISTRPGEGWDAYLNGKLAVSWPNIVLAGYSEGANQTAYTIRQRTPFGVILNSGGGSDVNPDDTEGAAPIRADWLNDPSMVSPTQMVGLWNEFETHDFQEGWTLSGIPTLPAKESAMARPAYGAYNNTHRLEYRRFYVADTDRASAALAHRSTAQEDALFEAHQYLVCKAGT